MDLHNYFRSSASFRVRIALHLKGLPFNYIPVDIRSNAHQRPAFAAITATGLVPVLQTDGGDLLTQSLAIIEYLEEAHPEPALLPVDPVERARVRALAQLVACEIHPLNNLRVLRYLVHELKVSEDGKNAWYRHWVRTGLEAFERELNRGPVGRFCHGDTPTLADCCLVPQIFNAQRFDVPLDGLTRTLDVFDDCMKMTAFQAAQPENCPDAQA